MTTRKYSLVIEGDSSAELPAILVTVRSVEELTKRGAEAIRLYWEHTHTERSPTSTLCEIEVEVPAYGVCVAPFGPSACPLGPL